MKLVYPSLNIAIERNVAFITIDHPPINLFDDDLLEQFMNLYDELKENREIKVVVFKSADEDFFMPHYNIDRVMKVANENKDKKITKSENLSEINALFEKYRKLEQVTIAQVEGRVGGGGNEFILALDMIFAAKGKAIFQQPEVGLGIIPGAGGTQRITKLTGRARAIEIILGSVDIDADTAELYGLINRAINPESIDSFVKNLAFRIASFPRNALVNAKRAIDYAHLPLHEGLLEERYLYVKTLSSDPLPINRLNEFLVKGGQTRKGEKDIETLLGDLKY